MSLSDRLQRLWRSIAPLTPPPSRHFFTPPEVGRLYRIQEQTGAGIDDQTWDDLLLPSYEDMLTPDASIFGRQMLHLRLRAGAFDDESAAQRARLQLLIDDPALLDTLDAGLRPLRHADAEVAGLLFGSDAPPAPPWARGLWLLPIALLASVLALVTLPLGWLLTLGALAPLVALQMRYHDQLERWDATLRALHALLRATTLLGRQGGVLLASLTAAHARAERLHVRLARPLYTRMIPGARHYADWFAAANVAHYFKTARIVASEHDFLRACYLDCANLEADAVLARHLLALERWCWAERGEARELTLEGGVHPLMPQPSALSVILQGRGAFVSGQNASGKSTFLRMVGLNLIVARAFGFCYARQHAERGFAARRREPVHGRAAPCARAAGSLARSAGSLPDRRSIQGHQSPGVGVGCGRGIGRIDGARAGAGVVAQPGAGVAAQGPAGAVLHRYLKRRAGAGAGRAA